MADPTDRELIEWLDARTLINPSLHPEHLGETVMSAFLPIACPLSEGEYGSLRDILTAAMRAAQSSSHG